MIGHNVVDFGGCHTLEDALAVRRRYTALSVDTGAIVVDMSRLDRGVPGQFLIGVLLNLKRFFGETVDVYLQNYPSYIPDILHICRLRELFVIAPER